MFISGKLKMVDFDIQKAADLNLFLFGDNNELKNKFWCFLAGTFAKVAGFVREVNKGFWVTSV